MRSGRIYLWRFLVALLVVSVVAGTVLVVHYWVGSGPEPPPPYQGSPVPGNVSREAEQEPVEEPLPDEPPVEEAVAPSGEDPTITLEAKEFIHEIRSEDNGDLEAVITGEKFFVEGEKIYRIIAPLIVAHVRGESTEELKEVSVEEVRLTAKQAVYDETRGIIRLYDSVKAEGSDFDILTDNATYLPAKRSVSSADPVVLHRYRFDPQGKKVVAMKVTGRGLTVDLPLRKMIILKDPKTVLYNVSEDFMMSAAPLPTEREPYDIVITAGGTLTYEHPPRRATFQKDVVVLTTSGDKELHADRLDITLGQNHKTDRLELSDIEAEGSVTFRFQDQLAAGDRLVWQNLTQAGVLSGEPAVVTTQELRITGGELTLFRVNMRFEVRGPGKLVWSSPEPEEPEAGAAAPEPPAARKDREPVSPVPLFSTAPIEVLWQESMTYDEPDRTAAFNKGVIAIQESSKLLCDVLKIHFRADGEGVEQVVAAGQVRASQLVEGAERKVVCDRAVWEGQSGVVRLFAEEGGQVTVSSADQKLVSSQVSFDPERGAFECPAAGELVLSEVRGLEDEQTLEPITVRWQKSMRFQGDPERFADFSGDVEVYRPSEKVTAQVLRVEFNEDMEPLKITAKEKAVLEVRRKPEPETSEPGGAESAGSEEAAPPEDELALPSFDDEVAMWRLSSEIIVAEPPKKVLGTPAAGLLELLRPDRENDSIRWADSMTASLEELFAQFEGDVVADFSGSELQCKTLRVEFDETKELRRINADGDVGFGASGENPWRLSASTAEAIFAPGSILHQLIARKDVEVQDAERTIKCQLLKLSLECAEGSTRPALSGAVATTDVVISYRGESELQALCDRLDWDSKADTYTLIGKPAEVRRGGVRMRAKLIFLDRKSGDWSLPKGAEPEIIIEGEVP